MDLQSSVNLSSNKNNGMAGFTQAGLSRSSDGINHNPLPDIKILFFFAAETHDAAIVNFHWAVFPLLDLKLK